MKYQYTLNGKPIASLEDLLAAKGMALPLSGAIVGEPIAIPLEWESNRPWRQVADHARTFVETSKPSFARPAAAKWRDPHRYDAPKAKRPQLGMMTLNGELMMTGLTRHGNREIRNDNGSVKAMPKIVPFPKARPTHKAMQHDAHKPIVMAPSPALLPLASVKATPIVPMESVSDIVKKATIRQRQDAALDRINQRRSLLRVQ